MVIMFDLMIYNATIIDGSGAPPKTGNLAIKDGKIVAVGQIEEFEKIGEIGEDAIEMVDAQGLCLAPGFIDSHSHGDQALGLDCSALSKLAQGITTEIAGQCGLSLFP